MKMVTHEIVENIISKIFDDKVKISDGNFIEFTYNKIVYIAYSSFKEIPTQTYGLVILENNNNIWQLYPSIMSLLKINEKIVLTTKELIDKVTTGQSIQVNHQNGIVIICDKHDRILSIGKILQELFNPVVDLGFYLRSETLQ